VELRSRDPRVRIDQIRPDGTAYPVCTAPCRTRLPRDRLYVITGEGVSATSRFVLPDHMEQVTLNVEPGSGLAFGAGAVMFAGGIAAGYVGLGLIKPLASNAEKIASPALVIGGVAIAFTGYLITRNARTTVKSSSGSVFSDEPRRPRKQPALALTPRGLEF
jgi:hypothetical protein